MILSFRSPDAQRIFHGERAPGLPPQIQTTARRKLRSLAAATQLEDLRTPPGNRLERLQANREGQYSIRINDQWRICFRWDQGNALEVEIVDYH